MTKQLIMLVGLPRSGKTTWAALQGHPIVCPDAIRLALHGARYISEAEPHVWAIAKTMVRALFLAGHGVVVLDACNNTRKRRDEWRSSRWRREFHAVGTSAEVCTQRAISDGRGELVPVIERMAAQHEPAQEDEHDGAAE